MNSVYEFGVYLTHFCNVDLFRQGLYFFRVRQYTKEGVDGDGGDDNSPSDGDGNGVSVESRRYALPYRTMMGKQHEGDFLIRCSDRPGSAGHIDDVTSSYCSSVFRVQYQEQKVRLNEGCLFRLDLAWSPPQRVYISIELVFCELHASELSECGGAVVQCDAMWTVLLLFACLCQDSGHRHLKLLLCSRLLPIVVRHGVEVINKHIRHFSLHHILRKDTMMPFVSYRYGFILIDDSFRWFLAKGA